MLGSRLIRIFAALFVCSAVAAIVWPRATGYVSSFAVVNAPVLTVRAPVTGVILRPTPGLAEAVSRDDVLLDLRATHLGRAETARLTAELSAAEAEVAALLEQEGVARDVIDGLERRVADETESELVYLSRKLEQARADRALNEVAWDAASAEIARVALLVERGRLPEADLETLRFRQAAAEAELAADDAAIAALLVEIGAIEAALPSPAGTGRRDFAYDRLDDMRLALADIRQRRRVAEARSVSIRRQVSASEAELAGILRFQPTSSADGVIWSASRQAGASVTAGSDLFQILDCERRFLEVFFDERAFENLPPGTVATVWLKGADRPFEARVVSRHAAVTATAQAALDTAVPDPRGTGGVKVFLRLDPAPIDNPDVAAAFCDVGRTAEVQVRHDRLEGLLQPFRRIMAALRPEAGALLARLSQ